MIRVNFDDKQFFKEMQNIVGYSEGFLSGIESGKKVFYDSIAKDAIEIFKNFVDQQARVDEQMYHHIYEWYQTGSSNARLFDVEYIATEGGLSFNGTFKQSTVAKNGSSIPFYNKAEIMEKGISVTIKPKKAQALAFEIDGEPVFTKNAINVENPGGTRQVGAFEDIFDLFFKENFRQSVLDLTGISTYLRNAKDFKTNLPAGKTGGRAKGFETGYNWIVNAGGISD